MYRRAFPDCFSMISWGRPSKLLLLYPEKDTYLSKRFMLTCLSVFQFQFHRWGCKRKACTIFISKQRWKLPKSGSWKGLNHLTYPFLDLCVELFLLRYGIIDMCMLIFVYQQASQQVAKPFYDTKVQPSTLIPKQVGNMYTASLYAAFASLIHNKASTLVKISNLIICPFAYHLGALVHN